MGGLQPARAASRNAGGRPTADNTFQDGRAIKAQKLVVSPGKLGGGSIIAPATALAASAKPVSS